MRKKSLFETNRHLRNSAKYRTSLIANVSSSTAIETGKDARIVAREIASSQSDIFQVNRRKRQENS